MNSEKYRNVWSFPSESKLTWLYSKVLLFFFSSFSNNSVCKRLLLWNTIITVNLQFIYFAPLTPNDIIFFKWGTEGKIAVKLSWCNNLMKIVMINVDSDHLEGNFNNKKYFLSLDDSIFIEHRPNKFIKSLSNVPILGSKLVKDICFRVQVV